MKFFIIAALLATVALAAPAEDTKAVTDSTSNQSSALKHLWANFPAGHQVDEDGPAPKGCYWDGTAPFCAGSCRRGYTEVFRGPCGDGQCCWAGTKSLCCKDAD